MKIVGVNKRLNIALITERFGRKFGGAEAYAVNLFDILSRRHQVTVIAREFDHALPIEEVRIKSLTGWPSWIKALHFAYQTKKISFKRFDVVHTHAMGSPGNIQVVHVVPVKFRRLTSQTRWRKVLNFLQPRNIVYLGLEASSLQPQPDRYVVAVSPSVCEQIAAAYPTLARAEMIPPGATQQAVDPSTRLRMRVELGWGEGDIGCLLVARNPLAKGFACALQALSRLPQRYKLAVVGTDASARLYLLKFHPALSTRVSFVEPTSEVSPYYQSSDICVHPTLLDSFGMAPLEAMAFGLPVVLSAKQYCGFAAYVTHQHDGWVLDDPRNAEALGDALLTLGEGPALREAIASNSRALVKAFSWETVAHQYESLYFKTLSHREKA